MKTLLFFIESLSGGGAEKVLVTLLRHIDYARYNVALLTVCDVGPLKKELDFSKIKYRSIIKNSNNVFYKWWNKIKYKLIYNILPAKAVNKLFIPQKGVDTYIAFTEGYCTKILAHSPKNAKKIAWVHIDLKAMPWTLNEGIYKDINEERKTYEDFHNIVCVSRSVEEIMYEHYALKNVLTIYNPIDTKNIIEQSKTHKNFSIYKDGINIISIGRLVPQKGYDLLIPIIARLRNEGTDVNLYILGDGAEKSNLERIIQKHGCEKSVHLLGFLDNPYPILSEMDLFVCSSRSEGYSLVIAEALTLGIPVISTYCSGPNELLANGEFGELCNDYEELYSAIKRAATERDYYTELKNKAAKRKGFFNIEETIEEIERIL